MPESHDNGGHGDRGAVRRSVGEATRRLPGGVRRLPGDAVRLAVIGLGKTVQWTSRVNRTRTGREQEQGRETNIADGPAEKAETTVRTSSPNLPPEASTGGAVTPEDVSGAEPGAGSEPTAAETPADEPDESYRAPAPRASAAAPEELPVANYDELSMASLRGRLRTLTVTDLETLLVHERAHQNRSNVVTMFENRIRKLREQQS